MNRCETITSEEEDKKEEEEHLKGAPRRCGYPSWALKKETKNKKRKTADRRKKGTTELQKPGCRPIRRRCLREG